MKTKPIYFKQQKSYTCAAACMKMILAAKGIKKSERELSEALQTKLPHGVFPKNLIQLSKKLNLKFKTKSNSSFLELKKLQKEGYAVILIYFAYNSTHYAILKKISKKYLHLLDPLFGPDTKYQLTNFEKIWYSEKPYNTKNKWFLAIKQ